MPSIANLAACRTRTSCQGDFGSHCSGKYIQYGADPTGAFNVRPGVRWTSSASSARIDRAISTSPRFSAANRVDSSGITRMTIRFTPGVLRQYCSCASSTSSTPGLNETNLYGPAPIGARLKPSSPTFSRYAFGTIQPAPVAHTVSRSTVSPKIFSLRCSPTEIVVVPMALAASAQRRLDGTSGPLRLGYVSWLPDELVARIRALLRRQKMAAGVPTEPPETAVVTVSVVVVGVAGWQFNVLRSGDCEPDKRWV